MTRKDIAVSIPLLFLPILFLSGTLTSSYTFFMRDLTYLFHPWRSLSAQFLEGGKMPLWNAYALGGMPFLANGQSSILYPGTILFHLFNFALALKIFYAAHYALMAYGVFILVRKLGLPVWAAFAAAILYAYNGYALTRLEFLSILGCMLWLPWSLIFLTEIERSRSLSLAGLSLCWLFSFFSGFPQVFFMQVVFAFCFCLVKNPFKSSLIFLGISFSLFLSLSAVQWLPMAELWSHSIRSGGGVAMEEAGMYSLPWNALKGLLSPIWVPMHKDQFTGEKFFWIWSGWWGISAGVLMLFSFTRMKKKLLWLSLAFFMLGILWSLGNELPFFESLYRGVFIFHLFRYPPAALYWTVTSACFLTALGISALPAKRLAMIAAGIILAELWVYSRQIQVTIPADYFHTAFSSVRAVQDDPGALALLSPKINAVRRLPGVTSYEAATKFRAFLFDLTNLPYRIRTLNSSGEPLTLKSYGNLWNKFHGKTLDELRPAMNQLNITHFLTEDTMEAGWTLENEEEGLRVYRNRQALGEMFALPSWSPPQLISMQNDRLDSVWDLKEDSRIVSHIPKYPGWKIFCEEHGKLASDGSAPEPLENFMSVSMAKGVHRLHMFYDPALWKLGVLLFFLGISAAVLIL